MKAHQILFTRLKMEKRIPPRSLAFHLRRFRYSYPDLCLHINSCTLYLLFKIQDASLFQRFITRLGGPPHIATHAPPPSKKAYDHTSCVCARYATIFDENIVILILKERLHKSS